MPHQTITMGRNKMSFLSELKEITSARLGMACAFFLTIIAPGVLALLQYKPELVTTLETFKLLVISAALGLPVTVLNLLVTAAVLKWRKLEHDQDEIVAYGSSMAVMPFYVGLGWAHFEAASLELFLKMFFGITLTLWLLFVVFALWLSGKAKNDISGTSTEEAK